MPTTELPPSEAGRLHSRHPFRITSIMVGNARSAIVVMVDRVGAGWLGPYGNTWVDTPNWNRLAAESLLFEFVLADCPQLQPACSTLWSGRHRGMPEQDDGFLHRLQAAGSVRTVLVSDDPLVNRWAVEQPFDERLALPEPVSVAAGDIPDMAITQTFAAASDYLATADAPFLLWVHARGLQGPWDAPYQWRAQLADEEDPDPPDFVAPPQVRLARDYDPDELLGLNQAYGGQVAATDAALGAFLDSLSATPAAREAMLLITSPRGCATGEHRWVGCYDNLLYGETLHVPLLVRHPDRQRAGVRNRGLRSSAQTADLLESWLLGAGGAEKGTAETGRTASPQTRQAIWSLAGSGRAIRTPAWFLAMNDPDAPELYVKPDDRWEYNDVTDRCQDVVESLREVLERLERNAAEGHPDLAEELPPLLTEGLD